MSEPSHGGPGATHFYGPAIGTVISNHGTVIQTFVEGIATLPTDYSSRVEAFLTEYLGTPDSPVPFGGREAELAWLSDWLRDPSAPRYLFLAAPAGRGKSALLAQWSRRLLEETPELAVVFVPISVRFRTNLATVFFAMLTARLVRLFGEQMPSIPYTSVEVWRGLAADYLRRPLPDGRVLLVILDGIDEAADWQVGPDVFPLEPSTSLRVILSARLRPDYPDGSDWLSMLGWQRPGVGSVKLVEPLTLSGVETVLERMGDRLRVDDAGPDLVSELYRLTEGDPLLVRLYVETLSELPTATKLQTWNLHQLKPGLSGYFNRWWAEQSELWGETAPLRERSVRTVLGALACALGPLTREDLLALAPSKSGLDDGWSLEQAILPLCRFVIGDGRDLGYVFTHSRLGFYFREEKLSERERTEWEARYLQWGEETLARLRNRQIRPEVVSAYLVQHLGIHLDRSGGDPQNLKGLVSGEWVQCWEHFEGSYSGFVNDLGRARRAFTNTNHRAVAAGRPAPHAADEILCALSMSSIGSLAHQIPATLLERLVRGKRWSAAQGLTYIRLMPSAEGRASALAALLPHLPNRLILTAVAIVQDIEEPESQADAWVAIAPLLPADLVRTAIEAAGLIDDPVESARATLAVIAKVGTADPDLESLSRVVGERALNAALSRNTGFRDFSRAYALGRVGGILPDSLVDRAMQYAQSFDQEVYRSLALRKMAEHLARNGRSESAIRAARLIHEPSTRAQAFASLASAFDGEQARDALTELVGAALDVLQNDRASQFEHPPSSLDHDAEPGSAEAIPFAGIEDKLSRSAKFRDTIECVLPLLERMDPAQRQAMVIQCIGALKDVDWKRRWVLLGGLAAYLSAPDREKALEIVSGLADRYLEMRGPTAARRLPEEIGDLAPALGDAVRARREGARVQVEALAQFVPHLPPLEQSRAFENAVATAESIDDPGERASAYILIARATGSARARTFLLRALAETRTISKDAHTVRKLLEEMAPLLNGDLTAEALDLARDVPGEERIDIIAAIAGALPESLLKPAELLARSIEDHGKLVKTMTAFASFLDFAQRDALWHRVLEIPDSYLRCEAIKRMLPHMPEEAHLATVDHLTGTDEDGMGIDLAILAPVLGNDARHHAFARAKLLQNASERCAGMIGTAVAMTDDGRVAALREATDAYFETDYPVLGGDLVRALADEDLHHFLSRAQRESKGINHRDVVGFTIRELARRGFVEEAFATARAPATTQDRQKLLLALVTGMEPGQERSALVLDIAESLWAEAGELDLHQQFGMLALCMTPDQLADTVRRAIGLDDQKQAWMYRELIPHLSEELLDEVESAMTDSDDYVGRNTVFASLGCRFAALGHVDAALSAFAEVSNEYTLAEIVAEQGVAFPQELLGLGMWVAFASRTRDTAKLRSRLKSTLEQLPHAEMYARWSEWLESCSSTRDLCVEFIEAMGSVVPRIGGSSAPVGVVEAISSVGEWWP